MSSGLDSQLSELITEHSELWNDEGQALPL